MQEVKPDLFFYIKELTSWTWNLILRGSKVRGDEEHFKNTSASNLRWKPTVVRATLSCLITHLGLSSHNLSLLFSRKIILKIPGGAQIKIIINPVSLNKNFTKQLVHIKPRAIKGNALIFSHITLMCKQMGTEPWRHGFTNASALKCHVFPIKLYSYSLKESACSKHGCWILLCCWKAVAWSPVWAMRKGKRWDGDTSGNMMVTRTSFGLNLRLSAMQHLENSLINFKALVKTKYKRPSKYKRPLFVYSAEACFHHKIKKAIETVFSSLL